MSDHEVRFKIHKPNPRRPSFVEAFKGEYPKDIVEEIVVSSEDIEKMAILDLFGYKIPRKLDRADVRQAMINAIDDLFEPKEGIYKPYAMMIYKTLEARLKKTSNF